MKRKRFGWGWTPTTWQGWLFIVLQIGVLFTAAMQLPAKPVQPSTDQLVRLCIIVSFVIATIVLVGSQVGPTPRWRWGKKDTDSVDEDF